LSAVTGNPISHSGVEPALKNWRTARTIDQEGEGKSLRPSRREASVRASGKIGQPGEAPGGRFAEPGEKNSLLIVEGGRFDGPRKKENVHSNELKTSEGENKGRSAGGEIVEPEEW